MNTPPANPSPAEPLPADSPPIPALNLADSPFAPLLDALLELLLPLQSSGHETERDKTDDIPLILIGGFGLYVRRLWLQQAHPPLPTLLPYLPPVRSTEDFDLLIRLSLLADRPRMERLRATLDALGYEPVEGSEKYMFARAASLDHALPRAQVDLHAARPPDDDAVVRSDGRRVRYRQGSSPLHGHETPEAAAAAADEGNARAVLLRGATGAAIVHLPHRDALILMKLLAFADYETNQKTNRTPAENRAQARKHALDIYTLVASLTMAEYDDLPRLRDRHANTEPGRRAAQVVAAHFGDRTLRRPHGQRRPAYPRTVCAPAAGRRRPAGVLRSAARDVSRNAHARRRQRRRDNDRLKPRRSRTRLRSMSHNRAMFGTNWAHRTRLPQPLRSNGQGRQTAIAVFALCPNLRES